MDVENSITRDLWLPTLGIFIVVASRSEVAGRVLHFRIEGTSSIKILPANTYSRSIVFHGYVRWFPFFYLSYLDFKYRQPRFFPSAVLVSYGTRAKWQNAGNEWNDRINENPFWSRLCCYTRLALR